MALSPVGIRYVSTGIRPFLGNLVQARRQISQFSSSGVSLGQSLGTIGRQATAAGLGLTFFATVPIVTALFGAVKAASAFEDELIKLNTLSGLTQVEIDGIRKGILSLAPALGKVPTELAEAAFFITSTGDLRNAAAALEVLEVSAKASAIGLGETKVVAGAVTSVLAAYGFAASEAAHVTDVLTAAVDRGKFEAEQFAPAIGKILGLAAEMGVSFEEASNFIATYTLSGVTASQATTALQRVLLSIQKPTQAARDALAAVGLSLDEIQESVRKNGLTATLIAMRGEFDAAGISLGEFFTRVTGLTGVLFNTGEAADLFVSNLQAIASSAGIVERGFATVQQSTSFQVDQLRASFGVLGTTIGSVLLPAVNTALARIIPLVIAIADFAAQNPKLVLIATSFALIAAALGPLLLMVGFAITTFSALIGIVTTIGGALLTVIPPIGLIVAAFVSLGAIVASVAQHRFREAGKAIEEFSAKTKKEVPTAFEQLAANALNWGKNITINLARGLIAGAVAVVSALIQIGNVIASWLAPGSPPKLLPDLPEWGASAMSQYLKGFTSADFSVFDSLSSTIEAFMRNLAPTDSIELVPSIMNVREILAQAIRDVNNLAVVNDATVRAIVSGYGIAAGAAQDYIVTMLRLAEAQEDVKEIQEEINAVNTEFDARLDPLNEELQAIEDRRQEVVDQMRIEELQGILDDENAPALAKELALMELREIELRNQIDAEEEARDAALEALQAKLDAAEEEARALEEQAKQQEALIAAQEKQNDLIKEQIELLKRLAEELDDLGDAVGDTGGVGDVPSITGGGFEVDPIEFDLEGLTGEGFTSIAGEIKQSITDLVSEITGELAGPLEELRLKWEELGLTWSGVLEEAEKITTRVFNFIEEHGSTIESIILGIGAAFATFKALTFVSALISSIAALFSGGILAAIGSAITGIVALLGGPLTIAIAVVAAIVGFFVVAWRENWFNIREVVAVVWFRIRQIFQAIGDWIETNLIPVINNLKTWWVDVAWPAIQDAASRAWEKIKEIWGSIRDWVVNILIPKIQELATRWSEKWAEIKLGLSNAWLIIVSIWKEIIRWIKDNIIPWVIFLASMWAEKWKDIINKLGIAWAYIEGIFIVVREWLETKITEALTKLKEWWTETWDPIQKKLEEAWAVIEPIFISIKEWAETKIKEGLDRLKGYWDEIIGGLKKPIDELKSRWDALVGAVIAFWEWLTSHDFTIDVSIPDLPVLPGTGSGSSQSNKLANQTAKSLISAPSIASDVSAPSVALPARIAAAQAGGGQSNTFGPNYINNGMDEAVFAEKVRRVVTGGL